MRRKTLLLASALCVLATGMIGCQPLIDLLLSLGNLLDQSTYSGILAAADRLAKEQDANAIVFEVSGNNVGVLSGSGAMTTTYVFMAANPEETAMWRLTYDRLDDEWQVESLASPIVGVVLVDLTEIDMTEEQARAILTANGFGEDFVSWGLYQVLYPGSTNPVFSFIYTDKVITIDATNGAVTYQIVNPNGTVGSELPGDGSSPGEDSVSVQMIQAATTEIRETARSAFVLWAGGRNGNGEPLSHPGDTNYWDFYAAANLDSEPRYWTMAYDGTWHVTEIDSAPFGIEFIDLSSVTMDVVEAWGLAEQAGYLPPFNWWVLFKPLHPDANNPLYVFSTPYAYVFVDTVTGEVTEERTGRNPLGDCLYGCRESYLECVDYCRWAEPGVGDCYDDCSDSRDRCDRNCYDSYD